MDTKEKSVGQKSGKDKTVCCLYFNLNCFYLTCYLLNQFQKCWIKKSPKENKNFSPSWVENKERVAKEDALPCQQNNPFPYFGHSQGMSYYNEYGVQYPLFPQYPQVPSLHPPISTCPIVS